MKVEIKVPAMGESISQATIGSFIKRSGEGVAVDDELLELETDKVNQVLYAPEAGEVTWNVAEGDVVKIGQVIGFVETEKKGRAAPSAAKEKKAEIREEQAFRDTVEQMRVTKEMFVQELQQPKEEKRAKVELPVALPSSKEPEGRETRKKLSSIRKVIAKRLVEVLQETAMLTTFNEVDMTHIIALRESYQEAFTKKYNVRLGYMPFFVKAVVSALKASPEINAYISGDDLVYRNYFDIGIAVGTDKGVIVPIVRNCDRLSFAEIEQAIADFAKKSREGGLTPHDLQGGGFTITNGGTYGSLLSTPILNPPQSAILGMHKIMKRPVVVDDQIVIRQMMYLALSYDHRVVDGKEAVTFLVHIKNCLEDPSRMVLGV